MLATWAYVSGFNLQIGRFNLQIELRQHIETTACVSNLQIETFCTLGRLDLQTETANVSNLQIGFQSVDWVPICRLRRSAHWDQHIPAMRHAPHTLSGSSNEL